MIVANTLFSFFFFFFFFHADFDTLLTLGHKKKQEEWINYGVFLLLCFYFFYLSCCGYISFKYLSLASNYIYTHIYICNLCLPWQHQLCSATPPPPPTPTVLTQASQGSNRGPIRNRKIDVAPAGLDAFTSSCNDCRFISSAFGAITQQPLTLQLWAQKAELYSVEPVRFTGLIKFYFVFYKMVLKANGAFTDTNTHFA